MTQPMSVAHINLCCPSKVSFTSLLQSFALPNQQQLTSQILNPAEPTI